VWPVEGDEVVELVVLAPLEPPRPVLNSAAAEVVLLDKPVPPEPKETVKLDAFVPVKLEAVKLEAGKEEVGREGLSRVGVGGRAAERGHAPSSWLSPPPPFPPSSDPASRSKASFSSAVVASSWFPTTKMPTPLPRPLPVPPLLALP
jgi:hypothetical protein